jgi:hypothetical protein
LIPTTFWEYFFFPFEYIFIYAGGVIGASIIGVAIRIILGLVFLVWVVCEPVFVLLLIVTGFGSLWGEKAWRKWQEKHQWDVDLEAGVVEEATDNAGVDE